MEESSGGARDGQVWSGASKETAAAKEASAAKDLSLIPNKVLIFSRTKKMLNVIE